MIKKKKKKTRPCRGLAPNVMRETDRVSPRWSRVAGTAEFERCKEARGTLHSEPETRNLKPQNRNPKPEPRNPKPETLNPKPETRDPRPETRNPKTENRNSKPEIRNPRPETRNPEPEIIDESLPTLHPKPLTSKLKP